MSLAGINGPHQCIRRLIFGSTRPVPVRGSRSPAIGTWLRPVKAVRDTGMAAGSGSSPTIMQHARSAAVGPGIFIFLIPVLILCTNQDSSRLLDGPVHGKGPQWLLPAGVCYLLVGAAVMLATNISFHTKGRGTLAPWDAPKRLVVHGLYRYTRNPMFLGAFSMAFGEALIFNSRALLYYFLLVVAMQMVHVPLNEERWLRRGFGAEYEEYCRHVPRWLPRRTPYELRTKHKDT